MWVGSDGVEPPQQQQQPSMVVAVNTFIKIIHVDLKQCHQEVNIQTAAANAGVAPKIYQSFVTTEGFAIVMEKLRGKTLQSWLRSYPTPRPSLQKKVLILLLTAIRNLHGAKIQHGDLHTENIWVTEESSAYPDLFKVYLLDFGESQLFDEPLTLEQKAKDYAFFPYEWSVFVPQLKEKFPELEWSCRPLPSAKYALFSQIPNWNELNESLEDIFG